MPQSGVALLSQVNLLPQQICQAYMPFIHKLLEHCVIYAVTADAALHHASHAYRRMKAVLDFRPHQHSEALECHTRLQFLDKTTSGH